MSGMISYDCCMIMFSIKYSNYWNLSTPVLYPENKTVLMPGGPGYLHETGKVGIISTSALFHWVRLQETKA